MAVKKNYSRRVLGTKSDAKAPVWGGVLCEKSVAQVNRDRTGNQSLAQCIIALVESARQGSYKFQETDAAARFGFGRTNIEGRIGSRLSAGNAQDK